MEARNKSTPFQRSLFETTRSVQVFLNFAGKQAQISHSRGYFGGRISFIGNNNSNLPRDDGGHFTLSYPCCYRTQYKNSRYINSI